jgi:hypothetical protein
MCIMDKIPKDSMHVSHAYHVCGKDNTMRVKRYHAYMV